MRAYSVTAAVLIAGCSSSDFSTKDGRVDQRTPLSDSRGETRRPDFALDGPGKDAGIEDVRVEDVDERDVGATDVSVNDVGVDSGVDLPQQTQPLKDRGAAIARPSYDYAPSVMRDTDGKYKMWWCGHATSGWDVIFYAESSDNISWSTPQVVLEVNGVGGHGYHACDPSVVKASNGYYYLFFTSEGSHAGVGQDNQIFLATSLDGIKFNHVNNNQPVIPITASNNTYGIGQSSVLFLSGRFLHFYTDTTTGGGNKIFVAESGNGGTVFSKLNGGKAVLTGVTAVDVKYLASSDRYLVAAEGPGGQWQISFYLLDSNFQQIDHFVPGASAFANPCIHNPGLLGDHVGVVIDETLVPVYFGSGIHGTSPIDLCWTPDSWDIGYATLLTSAF